MSESNHDLKALDAIIRGRRSVYPKMYTEEPVTDDEILHILENARWAPTHKKTEPWRFRVFRGKALERLGEFFANDYVKRTPEDLYSERKHENMRTKPTRAGAVIGIYMLRDPEERLPEWEEIAAVSAAVQNMWLTAHALGIGSYWSTPSSIIHADDFVELAPGERCLGLLYLGKWEPTELPGVRQPVEDRVDWIDR